MEASLTVTEAARNLGEVVDRAHYRHEATTLLEDGRPVARIVPVSSAGKIGTEIAARMASGERPRLSEDEAEEFEADLQAARAALPNLTSPWD